MPVNVPQDERAILGRIAHRLDVSTGELLRRLYLSALQQVAHKEAAEIARIRAQRAGVVCLLAFLAVLTSGHDFVRHVRRGRRDEAQVEVAA